MDKFPNIDLNLLKLFASLYQTGSVTVTAETLKLSQSACSHALTRLRERLGDELFVRIENRMLPTAYAQRLAEHVMPALTMLNQGFELSQAFSPTQNHNFKIATTDYSSWCMQAFTAHLSQGFKAINIEFLQLEQRLPEAALKSGELDLACGFSHQPESSESLMRLTWLEDHYVNARCAQRGTPSPLNLQQFLEHKHILVTPWNESRGIVDISLAKIRKKRQIAIKTASVLAAPYFVQNTDYLLTLPHRYAQQMQQQLRLSISPLPFKLPNYQLNLYWHKTRYQDPKLIWFIEQFQQFIEQTDTLPHQ
ncbi:LysR family transcriptional regulator [Agarivorans sp. QJM3NY_33]|uniref:LysR family transcriptional regulator n=1 Tax=Agarivorans sp. QJM3NY_33 TaxID=3421432 RepID=UPI003D7EE980